MTDTEAPMRNLPLKWFAPIFLLAAAVLIVSCLPQILTRSGWDPDDQLRLVQLRDFLGGQSWFDTVQHRMNPPEGAQIHWSRLIELPLALFVLVFRPLFGQAVAEMIAGTAVPLICFGGIAWLLSGICTRLAGRGAGLAAAIVAFTSPAILIQMRPMRIDHHGWQIFCATLALATLFWANRLRASVILGLALAIWQHISLEGAPMGAAFFMFLGWRWVFDAAEGRQLSATLAAFAAASVALFLGTQAHGFAATEYCDTVSPAHIAAILAATAILLPAVRFASAHKVARLAAVGMAGLAAVGVLLAIAPHCAKGAFADLDPIVRQYWYVKISEGLPVWYQSLPTVAAVLITPLIAMLALPFAARAIEPQHRLGFGAVCFFLVYGVLLSLLVFRTISVATAISVIPIAILLAHLVKRYFSETIFAKRMLVVAAGLCLLFSGALAGRISDLFIEEDVAPAVQPLNAIAKKQKDEEDNCQTVASMRALARIPNALFAAPLDMGPAILLTTPHKVLASSHHRNRQGMRDNIDIFRSPPDAARAIIERRGVTHIAACRAEAELVSYTKHDKDGLWAAIAKAKPPSWLEPAGTFGKGIEVWRVR